MTFFQRFFHTALLATAASAFPLDISIRQDLDCSPSSTSGLHPECWAQLNVTGYINDWLAANGTAAGCDTLGFAQCFLQANGYGGRTCNLLTRGTCDAFETTGTAAAYESPQQFYTLWNIYAIYQYFNQFSEGLSNGATLASATIGDIVATVSPSTDPQSPNTLIWTSISGGFWMLAAGGINPVLGLVNTGLAVVTGMSSFFMQSMAGSSDARFTLLGEIGTNLADLIVTYQDSLQNALKELQDHSDLFIAAAEPGGFSSRAAVSLNVQTNDIFHDLQLYVLSAALKANGIVATRTTYSAVDFAPKTNGAVSCDSLSDIGTCNNFYVNTTSGNTYALHNPADWNNDYVDLLIKINDNKWANVSEIFEIEDCAGKDPAFDGTKVACLASHTWCDWDYDSQTTPSEVQAANQQFKNCDNDANWGATCGWMTSGMDIPSSYLGPLLETDGAFCRTGNIA